MAFVFLYKTINSAVRIDYFCSRLLVDYLSTSRLIVDYFSYNARYFLTLYLSK